MKTKKLVLCGMLAAVFSGFSVASNAASIKIDGTFAGTYSPFGGFDWASNGEAVVTGFTPTSSSPTVVIDLVYWSVAASVTQPNATPLNKPSMGILAGDYEYTTVANLKESATCTGGFNSIGVCLKTEFTLISGSWDIWYDTTPDAQQDLGAGFKDGVRILSGSYNPGPSGSFIVDAFDVNGLPTSGSGDSPLNGVVTFTDNTYVNPTLLSTTFGTEIKFGVRSTMGTINPTGTPDGAIPGTGQCLPIGSNPGVVCLQADGNQSFSTVPEPASVLLLGIGLLGLGATRRRQQ